MSNIDQRSHVSRSIRKHLVAGLAAGVALLAGVGGWAATTNLAGAVVASGHLVVDSYSKKVQHPSGGVVGEILVNEGDRVKAGDVVMRLDATQTRANLAIEGMAMEPDDDALFDMLRDEAVPPPLATQIILKLYDHPDADPGLAITPLEQAR